MKMQVRLGRVAAVATLANLLSRVLISTQN